MNAYTITKKSNVSTQEKHAAIIYLIEVRNETRAVVSELTGYAKSTIANVVRNATDFMLTLAKNLYHHSRKIVQKVEKNVVKRASNVTSEIIYEVENILEKPCAYVIEFFYGDGSFAWLKIGKADNILKRAPQHLSNREYGKHGVVKSVVKRLYYAEDSDDALTIENTLRKHYRAKDNSGFIKNDRFTNCHYNASDLDNDRRISAQLALLAA